MFSSARNSLRPTVVLLFASLCATAVHPQRLGVLATSENPDIPTHDGNWPTKCRPQFSKIISGSRPVLTEDLLLFGVEPEDHWNLPGAVEAGCAANAMLARDASPLKSEIPSLPLVKTEPISRGSSAPPPIDAVPAVLASLGKSGQRLLQARDGVLAILDSPNACSEWFQSAAPGAASVFRSLGFSIDRRGPENIFEWTQRDSQVIERQPYVAQATQDGGPYTTIRINANGAFYKAQSTVERVSSEGGPTYMDGPRLLRVGPYAGNTVGAQMVTLFHEFGHIINLLPEDTDDMDGKSSRNTSEVLRHCKNEIDAQSKEARQFARK